MTVNRSIILASRPRGAATLDNFSLVETSIPSPGDGQVLLRTLWLSLDPYMRGRIGEGGSYAAGTEPGHPMEGGTVSRVVQSCHHGLAAGDLVVGYTNWQEYTVSDGAGLRRLDLSMAPPSTALHVLGMTGFTAYVGLLKIGQPKGGETLVVAAASGPVGATVGQIGKHKGCRVVGIAGGPEKCRYVREELGFDAVIDHRDPRLAQALADACPRGVDIYFENVGGQVWRSVFPLLNNFARVPVCGLISHYEETEASPGPDRLPDLMMAVLVKRLTIHGFIVDDFSEEEVGFYTEMAAWMRDGVIKFKEDITDGLEHAPAKLLGLLKGRNFGKTLIRVSSEKVD